jgi:hypothetical protein
MSNRTFLKSAAFVAVVVLAAGGAAAFGIEPLEKGIGREHERITRAAVSDLDPKTLDALAGRGEDPGAVGSVDLLEAGPEAHCDNGDHLAEGTYPRTEADAEAALAKCRALIVAELEGAVGLAKGLIDASPESVSLDACDFKRGTGGAKCEVLTHLGRALHIAQDFYAYTNWVDQPAPGPTGASNPPGLGKTGRSMWLDPRAQVPFPKGLISGCTAQGDLLNDCAYGSLVPTFGFELGLERVTRGALDKGSGPIGKGVGGIGATPRGAVNNNFRNAVKIAIDDSRDKWAYFKERVRAVYGAEGDKILCALSRDTFDPAGCTKVAESSTVCTRRRARFVDDPPSSTAGAVEPSEAERVEATPLVERLVRFCQLEEAELTRDAVINGGTATEGRTFGKTRALDLLATWNACPVDGRNYLDIAGPVNKETLKKRQAGDKSSSRRELLGTAYAQCVLDARLQELGK